MHLSAVIAKEQCGVDALLQDLQAIGERLEHGGGQLVELGHGTELRAGHLQVKAIRLTLIVGTEEQVRGQPGIRLIGPTPKRDELLRADAELFLGLPERCLLWCLTSLYMAAGTADKAIAEVVVPGAGQDFTV